MIDAGVHEPVGHPARYRLVPRSRAPPAPTWPSSRDAADRGAAVEAMGAGAEAVVLRLHGEGRIDGVLALGGSGGSSIATRAMRALPVGVPEADGLDARLGRHAALRRRRRRDDDVLGRRHLRGQPDLGADHGQRRRRDRRDGAGDGAAARDEAARGGDDVRRHDAVRDRGARAARGARLRGARLPCDRHRRAVDGGAREGRLPRRRARRHDDRARRRARRRRPLGRARPADGRRRRRACRRSCRSARSTWSTSGRARRCRRGSRAATSTSTTRPSRSCARRRRSAASSAARSGGSSPPPPARRRSSCRCAACR